jgi:hypothetical protein
MRNDEVAAELSRWDAERKIANAWPYARRLCCADAEFIQCVCRISVRCPRHGTICVGSHD